jgi:hypothetical protein
VSKLLTVLYEVAEIRVCCQRVHDERFGLSPRRVLQAITGKGPQGAAEQCAELEHLADRLRRARVALHGVTAEDIAIRRGTEINDTLRRYVDALEELIDRLAQLYQHVDREPAGTVADDTALRAAYDAALQHQKRLAGHLNELVSTL